MERVLFHKYKILRLIGSGGMGQVWLAQDTHLNQQVVIKESREEFLTLEVALLKELEHPGLPMIYDCFCEEGKTYLVMEYIEGISLRQYLDKNKRVSEEQALKWAVELCGILGYLHERHPAVIYRDLKPENIMIKQNGSLKLIDFGGAMHCLCDDTQENFCVGTKAYSPMQQWQNIRGDITWDIYGLGVVLHEMLTGENPVLPGYKRYPVREYDRSLHGVWDKIIRKCVAAEGESRYQTVQELEEDLTGRRVWRKMSFRQGWNLLSVFVGGYTAVCFINPLLKGVPENEFPFPYLEKPLIFLIITLLLYFIFFKRGKKKYLRKREKNIWLSEKKFSGLIMAMLLVWEGFSAPLFSGAPASAYVHAQEEPEELWVEMRDDMGRKMLLKYDAVYETDDKVRFELPADRLPGQKLAVQIVAVGEDGKRYGSRVFYVRGIEKSGESDIVGSGKD